MKGKALWRLLKGMFLKTTSLLARSEIPVWTEYKTSARDKVLMGVFTEFSGRHQRASFCNGLAVES